MRTMKISLILSLLLMFAPMTALAESTTGKVTFPDIQGHWAQAAIEDWATKGMVNGYPDGTFRPDDSVTTAEFIVMVLNSGTMIDENGVRKWDPAFLARLPEDSQVLLNRYSSIGFEHSTPWYENYVKTADSIGILGKYLFDDEYEIPLTREKAAFISGSFSENNYDGWIQPEYGKIVATMYKDYRFVSIMYAEYVGKASIIGLIEGMPSGDFAPQGFLTRAEALTIISRIHDQSQRKPANFNLSPYPYAVVPGVNGYPDQIHIFDSQEQLKVYKDIVSSLDLTDGLFVQEGTSFYYYENHNKRELHVDQRHFPDDWYIGYVYHDLNLGISPNRLGVLINVTEGSIERQSDVIDAFLASAFKDEAKDVRQLIDDNVQKLRKDSNIVPYSVEEQHGDYNVLLHYIPRGTPYFTLSITKI